MTSTVAVLGATGVYGRHLVPRLAAAGYRVRALVRAPADEAGGAGDDGGAGGTGEVDVDDLRARLRERLSAYKVPRRVVVVPDDAVPMMSSGKLDLRALKELLRDA